MLLPGVSRGATGSLRCVARGAQSYGAARALLRHPRHSTAARRRGRSLSCIVPSSTTVSVPKPGQFAVTVNCRESVSWIDSFERVPESVNGRGSLPWRACSSRAAQIELGAAYAAAAGRRTRRQARDPEEVADLCRLPGSEARGERRPCCVTWNGGNANSRG